VNSLLFFLFPVVIGYLLGSIPFGYIVGKVHGIDITAEGSGSTGTTNALRLMGKKAAFFVLLGDFSKGLLAVLITSLAIIALLSESYKSDTLGLLQDPFFAVAQVLAALSAIIGHSKSVWIGFKGGKSVATGVGTLLALDWRVGLVTACIWALTVYISKYSSLGALIAVPLSPIFMFVFKRYFSIYAVTNDAPVFGSFSVLIYVLYCFLGAIYIIYKHKANIGRLLAGTEPKVGQKKPTAE
jgi:acyl phosphate:glycerol-3-phosphate acyltransferase